MRRMHVDEGTVETARGLLTSKYPELKANSRTNRGRIQVKFCHKPQGNSHLAFHTMRMRGNEMKWMSVQPSKQPPSNCHAYTLVFMRASEWACIMTNVSLVYSTSRCIVSKLRECLIIINMAFCQNYVDTAYSGKVGGIRVQLVTTLRNIDISCPRLISFWQRRKYLIGLVLFCGGREENMVIYTAA